MTILPLPLSSSICNYHRSPPKTLAILNPNNKITAIKASRCLDNLLLRSIAGALAFTLVASPPLPSLASSQSTIAAKPEVCVEEQAAIEDEKPSASVTNEELVEEAWEVVNESYVGGDVGNRPWSAEIWKQMKEYVLNGKIQTRARAHDVIRKMLASVGDPYTRFLSPPEFSKMARYDVTGIGINLREIPDDSGAAKLKVLGIILDGPAHATGVRQVWNLYISRRMPEVVDPVLEGKFPVGKATRVLQVGLLCAQASDELRPLISLVVKMLRDDIDLPPPTQPPFLSASAEY